MSLPSQALFFNENDEIISSPFINCGWFYNGKETIVKMIAHLYAENNIPEFYTYVKIYEEILVKEEMDYIISRFESGDINNNLKREIKWVRGLKI